MSTILLARYLGHVSSNTGGLSLVRMKTEMTCLKPSLVVNIAASGNQVTNHIIQLMMKRMVPFMPDIKKWQKKKKR